MVELSKRVGATRSSASMTVSLTVIVGNSAASWNDRIRPRCARSSGPRCEMSRRSNRTKPVSGLGKAPEQLKRRRLAGAVRSDEAERLPRLHGEADVVDRDDPAESL